MQPFDLPRRNSGLLASLSVIRNSRATIRKPLFLAATRVALRGSR